MRKLKIAMLYSYDSTHAGGVPHHVEALSNALIDRGHEVHVFGSRNTKFSFPNFHEVMQITSFAMPNGGMGAFATALPGINPLEIFEKEKFDICHIHDPFVPMVAWEIAYATKVKKVGTFHTCWNSESVYRHLKHGLPFVSDYYASKMDASIYVSPMSQESWSSLSGKVKKQLIIANGVSDIHIPAVKKNKKTIDLVFLARIVPRKGLMVLLRAVKRLLKKYPQIRLSVIGSGPEMALAKEFVEENNLEKIVKFRGELLGSKKVPYLQQADIFCAPYRNEAFGMTILEAMACGCPVVGYWEDGYKEYLSDYPHAAKLFAKDKTAEELVKNIRFLLENPKVAEESSKGGVEISKNYRWDSVAQKTEELYYTL